MLKAMKLIGLKLLNAIRADRFNKGTIMPFVMLNDVGLDLGLPGNGI